MEFKGSTYQDAKKVILKQNDNFELTSAVILAWADKITLKNSQISAPHIFLKSGVILDMDENSKLEGEIHYTNDPDFCSYGNEFRTIYGYCVKYGLLHDEL